MAGIALQEIGEIVASERAGKEEAAARILLRQLIEIEPVGSLRQK